MTLLVRLIMISLCLTQAAFAGEPLIVAHRGLSEHAPENTLAGFRACLELRLGFEFDVRRTKDGQLVCLHDSTLDHTTNGTGRLADFNLEEVRRFDAGHRFDSRFAGEKVPMIDEVLELVALDRQHSLLIAVDLKADGVEHEIVRLAEKHRVLPRLLFIGKTISEPGVRDQIKQASSQAQTAAVANTPEEFSQALAATKADWVYFRFLPTREQVDAVHAANKQTFIAGKAVSSRLPDNWRQAAEAGIDGILTDEPLELGAMLRKNR